MRFHNPLKRPKVRIRRPRIRIRWRKSSNWWAVGVAVAFFVTLFALHVVLMRHAKSIIRDVLDSRVRQATEGFYSSTFDHIEVSYANRDLIIHNLHIYPDSSRLIDRQGKAVNPATVFDVLIPELRIEGLNLKRAYLKKELKLERLNVVGAQVQLHVNFDIARAATDSLKEDLNQRLASFFKIIQANEVLVSDAKLDLHTIKNNKRSLLHSSFNAEATNLLVKTALQPQDEDWMHLDRFIIQAGPVNGFVADKTYLLRLKGLTASSADSSLFIQDFQLLPTSNIATLLDRKPDLDHVYTINVPKLYTYGIDFDALLNKKEFAASEITLFSPTLELYDAKPSPEGKKENFKPEDLYPAIEKVLHRVAVNKIVLRHGQTLVRNREERFLTKLHVNIQEASVFNFVLDSAAQHQTDKLFFADSVRLNLQDYQLRLSDNLHLLKADELILNSNQSSASAVNLRLEPDTLTPLRKQRPALYHVAVPALKVAGIDLLQLYNNNRLLIDSLSVKQPNIAYTQQLKREKSKQQGNGNGFKQEDLYGLISEFLYQLNIEQLTVDGGTVAVGRNIEDSLKVFTTQIHHAYLWNLQIDSASAYQLNKLFYADNFDLRLANYSHQLPDGIHAIEAKSIGISTLKDRIYISGINIYNLPGYEYPFKEIKTRNIPTLINIKVPYLELNGVDILKSYLTKRLEVKEVVLPEPVVHVASRIGKKNKEGNGIIHSRTLYALIEDFAEVVSVESLRLTNAEILTAFYSANGLLQLNSPSASVAIDNFRFDGYTSRNPKRLFFADAVTVVAHDFLADLPDERYQITADLLKASTAGQSITAEGVILRQPEIALNEENLLLQGRKGVLAFELPSILITGLDFDRAYYDEELHIDSIKASNPSLSYLTLAKNGKKTKKPRPILPKRNLYESLSPFFQKFSVGVAQLENGTIQTLTRRNGELQQTLLLDKISVAVDNFNVDSISVSDAQRFFYSENIRVHIGQYRWFLPDNVHQVTAGNLDLSTRSNLIRASAVKLAPISNISLHATTTDRYNITVPELILVGIPFDEIFDKEELRLKKLEIINPDIEIRKWDNKETKKGKRERSLPELLSAGLNLMQIEEAVLTDGKLRFVSYGEGEPLDLLFPQLDARLTNFAITPQTKATAARPFFADNLELQLYNWKRLLPDSIHWLEAETIRFSAKDSLLLAQNLEIYPDNAKLNTKVKPLINAQVPTLRLEGLSYNKLASDSLVLDQLWVMNPVVNILQPQEKLVKEEQKPADTKSGLLKLIKADSISVVNGVLVLRKIEEQDTSRVELNNLFVKAKGFLYDSIQQHNKERILYTDNLEAGLKNYKAVLGGGYYEIEAKEMGISTGRQQLWADSVRVTPAMDKNTFAQNKGFETDQFTFRNRRLLVDSLDLRKLFHDKTIEADKITIEGFNLYVYRDKRQPYPSKKRPRMPQEILREADWKIMIRETELNNGYIAYAERVKGASEDGFIDLTNLYLHADTITNYPAVLDSGYITTINASMKLMGRGNLKARFEIPMGDTTNQHIFYGSLDQMDLSNFNPILEKTVFISIRSGHADQINFKVIADREQAEGAMEFEYSDLKVDLVNKKTGKPGGIFRRLGSSVANMFVHTSNTTNGKQENLRSGEIEVKRDEKRSVVNYWVKTLIEGFKSSIGI